MAISREELPENFFDTTSADLLIQPEPQYLYAQLFMAALGIELNVPDMIGMPGREIGGVGADYKRAEDDRLILATDIPKNVFQVKADFKAQPGHTMRFNRPQYVDTTYTLAARQIGTSQTISTVPVKVDSEQNKLTIVRLGGPYDNANGRVAPFALDNFDSSMGIHNVSKIVGAHMKRDFHKTLDTIWVQLVDSATSTANGNIVYPEGMTTDNDALAKGQFTLSYEQINRTSQQMDDANLPTLPDGKRMLVVTPAGEKQMKDDPQYARYATFFKEVNPLFPGWFGTSPEFHLFKSTTLTKQANTSSVKIHYGHALAPSVFMGGIGEKVRVAASSDDNYGETAKLIWLAYLAMGIADYRFAYGVRYTENAQ